MNQKIEIHDNIVKFDHAIGRVSIFTFILYYIIV